MRPPLLRHSNHSGPHMTGGLLSPVAFLVQASVTVPVNHDVSP